MASPGGVTISVDDRELKRQIAALSARMAGNVLERAAQAGADIAREEASRRAPRRTGKLARNIETEVEARSRSEVEVAVGPNKEAWYGGLVETGTSRQAAQPYLRPALDENEGRIVDAVASELRREIGRVAR